MTFTIPLPWQEKEWHALTARLQANTLPHALLLTGVPGLGKELFAMALAKKLLCQTTEIADQTESACGQCQSCLWMAAGTHPDLFILTPENAQSLIKIAAVRNVIAESTRHAHQRRRAIVIHPADRMHDAAHQALLRLLEEPIAGDHFILVTAYPGRMPATIRSRCQSVTFKAPLMQEASTWLSQQTAAMLATSAQTGEALTGSSLNLALALASNAPLAALQLGDEGVLQWKKCWQDCLHLMEGRVLPVALAQKWRNGSLQTIILSLQLGLYRLINSGLMPLPKNSPYANLLSQGLTPFFNLYQRLLRAGQAIAEHPQLNAELFLESLLIDFYYWKDVGAVDISP